MNENILTGSLYSSLIKAGALNLYRHIKEVNDLNVFPIPDGDTGDNMYLTIKGGATVEVDTAEPLDKTSLDIANGMIYSARGNSGVITSQFFEGLALGFANLEEANVDEFKKAFEKGKECAYFSVAEPTEGTILTVIRESIEATKDNQEKSLLEFLRNFIDAAKISLEHTPELLDVLKEADVVDSGGAGLIYIIEGMIEYLEDHEEAIIENEFSNQKVQQIDLNSFTENSVLEFGYCTEFLLRLTRNKVNPDEFDPNIIIDYLKTIGNSIVCFKNGTMVKVHVHTMTPEKVFEFVHQFGEFLTVKVENMSLQHNSIGGEKNKAKKKIKYGIIETAPGKNLKDIFIEAGANEVVDGGQCMNPSIGDFLDAFKKVNAENIFVFPNNSNIYLAATQAAQMYKDANVIVINNKSLGEGHAALMMYDPTNNDPKEIEKQFYESMQNVITAEVSICSRDSEMNNLVLKEGDYIGFIGKDIVSKGADRVEAAKKMIDTIDLADSSFCIVFYNSNVKENEEELVKEYLHSKNAYLEIYTQPSGDLPHDFMIIIE